MLCQTYFITSFVNVFLIYNIQKEEEVPKTRYTKDILILLNVPFRSSQF